MESRRLESTFAAVLLGVAFAIAGCAGPPVDKTLQDTRQRLQSAAADDRIRAEAAGPLADAERTLEKAGEAEDPTLRHHFTYLAAKNLDIADAIVARKRAERRLAALRQRREEAIAAPASTTPAPAAPSPEAPTTVQVEPVPPPAPAEATPENDRVHDAGSDVDAREADRLIRDMEQERRRMATRDAGDGSGRTDDAANAKQKVEPRQSPEPAVQAPDEILFAAGTTELSPGVKRRLDPLVVQLRENPEVSIVVEGHTDSSGAHDANLKTSLMRANAVKAYLVDNGIESGRVKTLGLGAAYPVAGNETEEDRRRNRRAEIILDPSARNARAPRAGAGREAH